MFLEHLTIWTYIFGLILFFIGYTREEDTFVFTAFIFHGIALCSIIANSI